LEVRLGGDQKQTQSVLPPSTHDSGVDYAWLPGLSIDEVDLMEVPAILAAQFANVETRLEAEGLSSAAGGGSRKPDEHWDSIKDGVAEGGRNEALTSLVGRWLSNMVEIDVNDVKERAVNWGRKCSPPLPERECLAVVRSIVGKERRRRAAEDDGYDIPAVPAASIPAIPSVASVAANSPAPAAASAAMPQPQGDDLMSCELVVVEGDPTYFRFRCTAVSEKWVELSDWAPPLAAMKRAFFKATLQPLPAAIAAKWKRFPDRLAKARQVVQADSSTDAICIVAREIVVALQRHAMEYESFDSIDPSLMFHTVRFIVGGTSYIHGDELFQRLRGDTQLPEITRPRVYRVLSDCGAEHVTVRIGSPEKNIKRRLWRAPQPAIDRISSIGLGE
jgi:hypothetical protein